MISRTKLQHIKWTLLSIVSRINNTPVFVLGNQKSGTSAISWLLSQATQKSHTLDITRAISEPGWQAQLVNGQMNISTWRNKYAFEFSRQIIKEPALTLFTEKLIAAYPNAQFVFIVRDPRDNIRSILNRINIPGTIIGWPDTESLGQGQNAWDLILSSDWLGDKHSTGCIASLAYRWNYCCEQFLKQKDNITLIRYEDFKNNKVEAINALAKGVGLDVVKDITSLTDHQLQSKGDNTQSWLSFFGEDNLRAIDEITEKVRLNFDYH